ncbi:MAG: hypothetical protein ACQERF_11135, partial [Actinomycetota bacterium]
MVDEHGAIAAVEEPGSPSHIDPVDHDMLQDGADEADEADVDLVGDEDIPIRRLEDDEVEDDRRDDDDDDDDYDDDDVAAPPAMGDVLLGLSVDREDLSVRAEDVEDEAPLPEGRFADRELSWLAFNQRVIEQAEDKDLPLLERAWF